LRGCRSSWGRQPWGAEVAKSPSLEGLPALVTQSVSEPVRRAMLPDHKIEQERRAKENRQRRMMPREFGMFIASLAAWDWFINPLSFRDRTPGFGPPARDIALSRVNEFLLRMQIDAGQLIGWVIAEEFGRLGGRYHCHALITGVRDLSRQYWQREAYRCFGHTRVEPFDSKRGAPFYVAKYEGRLTGNIKLGGFLKGRDLSKCVQSHSVGGCRDVVISAPFPKSCFHMCLARRHR
jgi:hypothetical protein